MDQDLHYGIGRSRSLRDGWYPFFPDATESEAETYAYPLPYESQFWAAYAEPLVDFLAAADAFEEAARQAWGAASSGKASSLRSLRALTAPVSPAAVRLPDGRVSVRWASPSLLATLATMALLDSADSYPLALCQRCENWFAKGRLSKEYCGKTCQKSAEITRYRERKRRGQRKTSPRRSTKREKPRR